MFHIHDIAVPAVPLAFILFKRLAARLFVADAHDLRKGAVPEIVIRTEERPPMDAPGVGLRIIRDSADILSEYSVDGRENQRIRVKCVSAERGRGSKSRVHFLGYSLAPVWVSVWVRKNGKQVSGRKSAEKVLISQEIRTFCDA